jgi:hypothetical protein
MPSMEASITTFWMRWIAPLFERLFAALSLSIRRTGIRRIERRGEAPDCIQRDVIKFSGE